ncbi:MAG: DNA polymerase I [Myxococcota bacterium]
MAAKKKAAKAKTDTPGTPLPPPADPSTLYVIDISGYIFRAYHALPPLSTSRGEPTHAVRGVTTMLMKLIRERKPRYLAVALDSRKGSFRRDIYGKYKANRPAPPEDLASQITRIYELCEALGIPLLAKDGMEADDVIATAVVKGVEKNWKVVVVSADKDLLQLVGDNVVMWDTMRERVFGVPETIDKFGVPPKQVRDLLALTGDTSDNVPGVPSVGPKTAAKLLKAHDTLDGVFDHLDEVKGRVKEKLREHEDAARLSQELVTLRDDLDIELDEEALHYDGGEAGEVRRIFTELEFTRLLAQLDPAPSVAGKVEVVTELERLEACARNIRDAGEMSILSVLMGNDPLRDDLVGIAISWVEGLSIYIPIAHRYIGAPESLPLDEVLRVLRPLLENSLFPKRCADLKREDLVWGRRGITWRGGAFDVALGSYLYDPGRHSHALDAVARAELGAEIGSLDALKKPAKGPKRQMDEVSVEELSPVAGAHADFVLRLSHLLGGRMDQGEFPPLYYGLEIPLAHVLADMERIGVRIDASLLQTMSAEAGTTVAELEKTAHELAGHSFNVGSPRQLETILFDELGLPVKKRTKTARSTDASVLEELALLHDLPDVILEHRSLSKLKGTYLDALPAAVHPDTGRIHTRYNQAVAATGRLSSSDPNLQNIPIRTELGRRIRDAFIPRDGCALLAADYSQIELRVLAHLSQDPELIDAYTKADDVHVRTATALFDVPAEEVTREQRGQAKTVNFAVIYGQTRWALARNLRITQEEAQRYIEAFFERYLGVQRFMDEIIDEARATGYVMTLLGRRRALADMRSKNPSLRHAAERVARNTPIQGTAADIIKVAMIRVHKALRAQKFQTRMILTVHDELLFEVPLEEKDTVAPLVKEIMEGAMELSVPLVVDMGWGENWGKAH